MIAFEIDGLSTERSGSLRGVQFSIERKWERTETCWKGIWEKLKSISPSFLFHKGSLVALDSGSFPSRLTTQDFRGMSPCLALVTQPLPQSED